MVSIFIHIIILNFVWVGFSVPSTRQSNTFIYLGEILGSQIQSDSSRIKANGFNENMQREISSASFAPWVKMRQVNKPQ